MGHAHNCVETMLQDTPEGTRLAYLTAGGIVLVMGTPPDEEGGDETPSHNCDEMGCGSVGGHVLERYRLAPLNSAAAAQATAAEQERDRTWIARTHKAEATAAAYREYVQKQRDMDRARRSRLKDALMFKLADLPHADGCSQDPCDCWRAEAIAAVDENGDADLMTKLRDLQDQVDGEIETIGDAVAPLRRGRWISAALAPWSSVVGGDIADQMREAVEGRGNQASDEAVEKTAAYLRAQLAAKDGALRVAGGALANGEWHSPDDCKVEKREAACLSCRALAAIRRVLAVEAG